jgi:hypothetical protein
LTAKILTESRYEFDPEILYVIDSQIVLAQINMNNHQLSVYVGPRVAEIKNLTKEKDWWFVYSKENPCADLLSRGTVETSLLAHDSTWQRGPDWLHTPRSSWPITQTRESKLSIHHTPKPTDL